MAFRILVFGRNGQVGWELQRSLAPLGEVISLDRGNANISKRDQLREIIAAAKPQVILNAAAYTAVMAYKSRGETPGKDLSPWLGALIKPPAKFPTFDFMLGHLIAAMTPWSCFAPFAIGRMFIAP